MSASSLHNKCHVASSLQALLASMPASHSSGGYANILDYVHGTESPVSWLIPDFIPEGSLIALAGEPGTGKSFLAYTLGMALATGATTLGWHFEHPRTVLYFDQENAIPDSKQYARWIYNGLQTRQDARLEANFHLVPFGLGGADWASKAAVKVQEVQPALIIIDTTTPACNIQKEEDNAEAARVIQVLRALIALTRPHAACLAIKHAKVRTDGKGYTLRGAKTWEGAVDSIVYHLKANWRPTREQHASGLKATRLIPSKTRAFGLKAPITIFPVYTTDGQGIILQRGAPRSLEDAPAEDVK